MYLSRLGGVLISLAISVCAGAYTVGGMNRPTFDTAPQGNVRPGTQPSGAARPSTSSTGEIRPTTQPGNSMGRFTEPTGPVRPTTPEGLSSQRFTPPTGPVRPGLDSAASAMQEAFSLAPEPSNKSTTSEPASAVKPAEGASAGGIQAAKLGGGEEGMGGMTAAQQAEREKVAKNSEAAAALDKARDQKAMEADAMSKIQGAVDALNSKNNILQQKAKGAKK
ncbi:hypothetical protein [Candidatus Avelusimicrobium aviculae]|uniref:hypothetical protein n=1 Tax=Candidatus Avelusimicrobium aviculae TaxID=3416206 RepID=UPI003D0E27CA